MGAQDMSYAKCQHFVPGNFKQWEIAKDPVTGQYKKDASGKYERVQVGVKQQRRLCAKRAVAFVRLEYAELRPHHEGSGQYHDVFPFCADCWAKLRPQGIGPFTRWGEVNGVRGTPKSVAEVPAGDVPAAQVTTPRLRAIMGHKANIKRLMRQRNSESVTLDDWRKLLSEVVDEFVVEEVMRS